MEISSIITIIMSILGILVTIWVAKNNNNTEIKKSNLVVSIVSKKDSDNITTTAETQGNIYNNCTFYREAKSKSEIEGIMKNE